MARKNIRYANDGLSPTEILEGIRELYSYEELPAVVWTVLEADAEAPLVDDEPPFDVGEANGFYRLANIPPPGVTTYQYNLIRNITERIATNYSVSDTEGLTNEQTLLYRELKLGEPPVRIATQPGSSNTIDGTTAHLPKRQARQSGDASPSDWEWDPNDPLGSAQVWAQSLLRCEHLSATPKLLGWAMREVANTAAGRAYLGNARAAKMLGIAESTVKGHRKSLKEAGYIKDTKTYSRDGFPIYRLTIPRCCEGLDNPDPAKGDD